MLTRLRTAIITAIINNPGAQPFDIKCELPLQLRQVDKGKLGDATIIATAKVTDCEQDASVAVIVRCEGMADNSDIYRRAGASWKYRCKEVGAHAHQRIWKQEQPLARRIKLTMEFVRVSDDAVLASTCPLAHIFTERKVEVWWP